MKRKAFYLFSSYAFFTMLCFNSVSAQNGVLLPQKQTNLRVHKEMNRNTPRRGDATNSDIPEYIGDSGNINNEFGAGESSSIRGGNLFWPNNNNWATALTPVLQIGSDYSKNIVIKSYNANGLAYGSLDVHGLGINTAEISTEQIYPVLTTGYVGKGEVNLGGLVPNVFDYKESGSGSKTTAAPGNQTYFYGPLGNTNHDGYGRPTAYKMLFYHHFSVWLEDNYNVWSSGTHPGREPHPETYFLEPSFNILWPGNSPYTSTGEALSPLDPRVASSYQTDYVTSILLDDETPLMQFAGDTCINNSSAVDIPKTSRNGSNANTNQTLSDYRRPTTIAVQEDNVFDQILFKDLKWYYEIFEADYILTDFIRKGWHCHHTWSDGSYIAGIDYRNRNAFWDATVLEGNTYLDAAVQLLDSAVVCVTGDVTDATTGGKTSPSADNQSVHGVFASGDSAADLRQKTNILIVLPDSGGRFTMRTHGNFLANMHQERTLPTFLNAFYSQLTFPDANASVYLMPDTIESGAPDYLYATYGKTLKIYDNGGDMTVNNGNAVPTKTNASIFGVYGKYDWQGNMARVHTTANGTDSALTSFAAGGDNNPGIIEVGPATAAMETGAFFYIYSGGMLKNFECANHPVSNFAMHIGTPTVSPVRFQMDGDEPLYIVNFGNGATNTCDADLIFHEAALDSVEYALDNASAKGALHIQALADVLLEGPFSPVVSKQSNETRILSDSATVQFRDVFDYENQQDSNLIVWSKAPNTIPNKRSCIDDTAAYTCHDNGVVYFAKSVNMNQQGKGITLLRSEYDDVLFADSLDYTSGAATELSGEIIIQAGQDIYAKGPVTFETGGQKSILFEAKNTDRFGDTVSITKTGGRGNITFKGGYGDFSVTADPTVANYQPLTGSYVQTVNGSASNEKGYYDVREACASATGADVWFGKPVKIDLSAIDSDTVTTIVRAFNSVYFDDDFDFARNLSGKDRAPVTVFAETGNVEAIASDKTITFDIRGADSSAIIILAGNQPENICATPTQFADWVKSPASRFAEFDGNILFNSRLNVTSKGTGNLLLSAARDMETQTGGEVTVSYDEAGLNSGDVTLTAGRHVETHAPLNITYVQPLDNADILIQAGRLAAATYTCSDLLCKAHEEGTGLTADYHGGAPNMAYDVQATLGNSAIAPNSFAQKGSGNGSILAFAPYNINYKGAGTILLTALNGDIVTDPYLHGTYANHDARIIFEHAGTGITRLEAIDIKLHDILTYTGTGATDKKNGRFYMAAFDSILTRSLYYANPTDTGSVFITATKYKQTTADCGEYDCATDAGGIHQGHIVLGYGADYDRNNMKDSIIFDYNSGATNNATVGANIHILAGFEGFEKNTVNSGYGGNITFDYTEFYMPTGDGRTGGFTEIRTPNGNIWGKDSILYRGINGDFLVDAGKGSIDDPRAILWNGGAGCPTADILNTFVYSNCNTSQSWRTGNIMLKGARLNFGDPADQGAAGTGNAIFRTREGFIDLYDAFTADSMSGDLLVYAGMDNLTAGRANSYGDASARDFAFSAVKEGSSIFFGADDNIMLNYGNSNGFYPAYGRLTGKGVPRDYDQTAVNKLDKNPYYRTPYGGSDGYIDDLYAATYNVNTDGYLFYKQAGYETNYSYHNSVHKLYRGGAMNGLNCVPKDNGARELAVNFDRDAAGAPVNSGGFAAVAGNYIDLFTKFTYLGGTGTGIGAVPGMSNLRGEDVKGYGLYLKSQYNGTGANLPERRRATCEGCGEQEHFPIEGSNSNKIPEMTYIGFHDDARIHTQRQQSLIEAPVIEFFGHAEMDAYTDRGSNTKITLKADSLIFHDSIVFDGIFRSNIDFVPFTADSAQRNDDMRYGVINDRGKSLEYYKNRDKDVLGREKAGPAVSMTDRGLPVIELGYQRCTPPGYAPGMGGDVVVAFKHDFKLPIFNTVVANNARISFLTDAYDNERGGEYIDAFIRTDLLRIRNNVEFYTDPAIPVVRSGNFVMATPAQMGELMEAPGIYMRHLHTEPGSELSLPGEDSLLVMPTTVVGGYGHIHEKVFVKDGGILAPGYASLMEHDCQTPDGQGRLTVRDLAMEQYSILRISMSNENCYADEKGNIIGCTQTDTVTVLDELRLTGKIPVLILPETELIDEGCFLFMEYDDTDGVSAEYAKNLILLEDRYGDLYFSLDFSEPGKVYLCVTPFETPEVERYVDLPAIEGATYNYVIINGERTVPTIGYNYVKGHQNFEVNLTWTSAPLKAWAHGFYSHTDLDLDPTATVESDGSVTYIIRQVVEPWIISFGPQSSTVVGNDNIVENNKVWTYRNTLYINTPAGDVVSIHNITGVLNRKVTVPAGLNRLTLDKGMYIVTLKDGKVYKIVVR
jgi:hypothetical protein